MVPVFLRLVSVCSIVAQAAKHGVASSSRGFLRKANSSQRADGPAITRLASLASAIASSMRRCALSSAGVGDSPADTCALRHHLDGARGAHRNRRAIACARGTGFEELGFCAWSWLRFGHRLSAQIGQARFRRVGGLDASSRMKDHHQRPPRRSRSRSTYPRIARESQQQPKVPAPISAKNTRTSASTPTRSQWCGLRRPHRQRAPSGRPARLRAGFGRSSARLRANPPASERSRGVAGEGSGSSGVGPRPSVGSARWGGPSRSIHP
jgi:hypothetical protein